MNEPERGNAASIDIDALLQNTWLQVISLHHSPQFHGEEGYTLWQHRVVDVEYVQHELRMSRLDDISCQHVLTAQCALLDEAVKGRGVENETRLQWCDTLLRGCFLDTIDAGDTLCKRICDVLCKSAPDLVVVACFQWVMLLGFVGSFRFLNNPEYLKPANVLSEHVPPSRCPPVVSVLVGNRAGLGVSDWLAF